MSLGLPRKPEDVAPSSAVPVGSHAFDSVYSHHIHAFAVIGVSRLLPSDSLKVRCEPCIQETEGAESISQ